MRAFWGRTLLGLAKLFLNSAVRSLDGGAGGMAEKARRINRKAADRASDFAQRIAEMQAKHDLEQRERAAQAEVAAAQAVALKEQAKKASAAAEGLAQ